MLVPPFVSHRKLLEKLETRFFPTGGSGGGGDSHSEERPVATSLP